MKNNSKKLKGTLIWNKEVLRDVSTNSGRIEILLELANKGQNEVSEHSFS